MGKTKRSQPFEFDEFVSQSRGSSSPYPTYPIEDIYPYEEGPPPEVILHPDVRSGEKAPPLAVSVKQSGPHPYRHRIRCYHLMACIVYFCCNCFLGALAFEYAGEHTGRTLKIFYYAKYNTIWYKWRYLPLVASGLLLDYRNLLNPSQWRHNECDGVSNHRHLACFLNRLFGSRSKKTSKLRVTGFCEVTGGFPSQRASIVEMFPFDDVIMKFELGHEYDYVKRNQCV